MDFKRSSSKYTPKSISTPYSFPHFSILRSISLRYVSKSLVVENVYQIGGMRVTSSERQKPFNCAMWEREYFFPNPPSPLDIPLSPPLPPPCIADALMACCNPATMWLPIERVTFAVFFIN